MASTPQFDLPLIEAAQAQKHVTVNEALVRLDAGAQLRAVAADVTDPPGGPIEGAAYLVPTGATGDWAGQEGALAVFANGGWIYLTPKAGWRLWVEAEAAERVFDGTGWIADAIAVSASGAATVARVVEIDHAVSVGAVSTVSGAIPVGCVVTGVSGRVTTAISGSATGWQLGVSASPDRYGSGLGVAQNSFAAGLTGQPQAYYAATDLELTAEGGTFAGGQVRLAVHLVEIVPPRAV